MVSAFHFPVDGAEPEFTGLQFESRLEWPLWSGRSLEFVGKLRANGCSSTCSCEYDTHDGRFIAPSDHTPLCRYIYITAPEQQDNPFVLDTRNLEVNRCIETLTGDTSWKGSVIAFAKNPDGELVDMSTSVFIKTLSAFRGVLGVRINCDRIVGANDVPRFEAVTVESYNLRGAIDH